MEKSKEVNPTTPLSERTPEPVAQSFRPAITMQMFDNAQVGDVLATGIVKYEPEGCNMNGTGKLLRFVAIRGVIDWSLYVHWADAPIEFIKAHGQKVLQEANVVGCIEPRDNVLNHFS